MVTFYGLAWIIWLSAAGVLTVIGVLHDPLLRKKRR